MKEKDSPPPTYKAATGLNGSETSVEVSAEDEKLAMEKEAEKDPWALVEPKNPGKKWKDMDGAERCQHVFWILFKVIGLLILTYFFICSLDFLATAFKLLGGKAAGEVFQNNAVLSNPVSNMMIGVLATVLVQSSSTSTSIVVTMVAADLLTVKPAIFIVMGANIGTSVTNTIVAMGQAVDRNEFRRAFGGATVHDMFNWLSVLILLPIEAIVGQFASCGPLCMLTDIMVRAFNLRQDKRTKVKLLKVITEPFTKLVIQIDKSLLNDISLGKANATESLIKHKCTGPKTYQNVTVTGLSEETVNGTLMNVTTTTTTLVYKSSKVPCEFLFEKVSRPDGGNWSDAAVGGILLVVSLATLCICLVLIVKLLHSLLRGRIAVFLKKVINADFPGVFKHLTGYFFILIGTVLTILVQSSSIFTSAITPLVGVGVLHIERMYPLTLGANIGTTFTAVLASLAADENKLADTLQVSLCHLFFNIFGIIIWYPVPFMRAVPIGLAKILGNTTAKYRWFALLYLFVMFFILPAIILGLSVAGTIYLAVIGGILLVFLIFVAVINICQRKCGGCLPNKLKNWDFLPMFLHSLEPYDRLISKGLVICKCCKKKDRTETEKVVNVESKEEGTENPGYIPEAENKV